MSTLSQAFLDQANSCEALDSPFMGRLLRLLAAHWPADTKLATRCADFSGDIGPKGHSLPLRIASGLHALVLQNADPALTNIYPPHASSDATFKTEILAALHRHDAFLCDWIRNTPQTNEVRRSAVLIAAAQLLAERFDLPLKLSELGASAGLNLMFEKFHLAVGTGYGPQSDVRLAPDWEGPLPPAATLKVAERLGVDLNPLDCHRADHALRLQAYLWADQAERLTRTRAAIAVHDAQVDGGDAIDWLQTRLSTPETGMVHMVYSTVAWQYFPPEKQRQGTEILMQSGQQASPDAPLVWLSYEADDQTPGAAVTLHLWTGNAPQVWHLGRADFHGRWIKWQGPARLP
ncbi:DUF2332 domain-containing protein [Shimia sp. R11_0]|uniref:DUF2332 domain-containing protein n=1 Tax=Shimia sp. R11_0 TaxID=2821096 RepID=UPI001ADBC5CF|nr:DUF2332 domain-containing protein [Shimia sp. R11_0]MBO9477476.1 DUF2332 domain-containing protein [Shimia sp. R11_0]